MRPWEVWKAMAQKERRRLAGITAPGKPLWAVYVDETDGSLSTAPVVAIVAWEVEDGVAVFPEFRPVVLEEGTREGSLIEDGPETLEGASNYIGLSRRESPDPADWANAVRRFLSKRDRAFVDRPKS
jgi:hypothetical protein